MIVQVTFTLNTEQYNLLINVALQHSQGSFYCANTFSFTVVLFVMEYFYIAALLLCLKKHACHGYGVSF